MSGLRTVSEGEIRPYFRSRRLFWPRVGFVTYCQLMTNQQSSSGPLRTAD